MKFHDRLRNTFWMRETIWDCFGILFCGKEPRVFYKCSEDHNSFICPVGVKTCWRADYYEQAKIDLPTQCEVYRENKPRRTGRKGK